MKRRLNNENTFKILISDLNQHLDYLKIKLNFELNDVILSAKLKASSKLMLGIIEEYKESLLAKYKQLVYKDDFGKIVLRDFDRELTFFCKNTLAKKYEYNNMIIEFAYDILHRKFLDHGIYFIMLETGKSYHLAKMIKITSD